MKRKSYVLTLICLSVILLLPTIASGHSYVEESEPSEGEKVEIVEEIVLTFNAGIENVSTATVIGEEGEVEGTVEVESPVLTIYLDDMLPSGEYEVQWQALGEDTHTTEGSFSFVVDAPLEEEIDEELEEISEEQTPSVEDEAETGQVIEESEEIMEEENDRDDDQNSVVLPIVIVSVIIILTIIFLLRKKRR
ncbi:copper resistance protein CopC [Halalkalibacter sp. APA_J-10(15)]|uniref:copper resistance CopC family protein n=1 Tax=unclassified Halalkalibacter TaxID=2893063 RepID=UPI001FF5F66C|nr:copper resistance protein CopC [Halalkalibacter sp. APA_J-10(15)]MCK0471901.1 copper resistance protein CopC [Halalkalibacter sp. APA_J-10(15)]